MGTKELLDKVIEKSPINPIESVRQLVDRPCACPDKVSSKSGLCVACDAKRQLRWLEGRAVDALRWLRMWHIKPYGEEKPMIEEEEQYVERLNPERHWEADKFDNKKKPKKSKELNLRV